MSDSPKIYLDNADSLSAILNRLQLSAEVYVNGSFCGDWAVDTSGSQRIPFHLIGYGEAWLHSPDSVPRLLQAGDLVVFPRDTRHTIASSEQLAEGQSLSEGNIADTSRGSSVIHPGPVTHMVCGFFELSNTTAWPLLDSLSPVIVIDVNNDGYRSSIGVLLQMMIDELANQSPGYYCAINQLAYLVFVEIIRQQIVQGLVTRGLLVAIFDHKIGNALRAIHNHPGKSWSLDSLAALTYMGRSGFAKRFKELTGITPIQYLTEWRMQEAVRMLADKTMSVALIAEQLGYDSDVAFRKAFKKVIGDSPAAVRKQSIASS